MVKHCKTLSRKAENILRDTQCRTGQSHEQSAVTDPAVAWALNWKLPEIPPNLNYSVILIFIGMCNIYGIGWLCCSLIQLYFLRDCWQLQRNGEGMVLVEVRSLQQQVVGVQLESGVQCSRLLLIQDIILQLWIGEEGVYRTPWPLWGLSCCNYLWTGMPSLDFHYVLKNVLVNGNGKFKVLYSFTFPHIDPLPGQM